MLAATVDVGTSRTIPGVGIAVAGPIAAALAGAGAGDVTGGLIGLLIGTPEFLNIARKSMTPACVVAAYCWEWKQNPTKM